MIFNYILAFSNVYIHYVNKIKVSALFQQIPEFIFFFKLKKQKSL